MLGASNVLLGFFLCLLLSSTHAACPKIGHVSNLLFNSIATNINLICTDQVSYKVVVKKYTIYNCSIAYSFSKYLLNRYYVSVTEPISRNKAEGRWGDDSLDQIGDSEVKEMWSYLRSVLDMQPGTRVGRLDEESG